MSDGLDRVVDRRVDVLADELHGNVAAWPVRDAEGIAARVIDAYSVKPIDVQTLRETVKAVGGRLVTVLRDPGGGVGRAVLATRIGDILSRRPSFDAASPLLPGFEPAPSFVF